MAWCCGSGCEGRRRVERMPAGGDVKRLMPMSFWRGPCASITYDGSGPCAVPSVTPSPLRHQVVPPNHPG